VSYYYILTNPLVLFFIFLAIVYYLVSFAFLSFLGLCLSKAVAKKEGEGWVRGLEHILLIFCALFQSVVFLVIYGDTRLFIVYSIALPLCLSLFIGLNRNTSARIAVTLSLPFMLLIGNGYL